MIAVNPQALDALAASYGTTSAQLTHFGGGREEGDGIIYAYPYQDTRRLLKIMVCPVEDQQRGLFCTAERLRFMRFLGDHGAPVVCPLPSPQGNLFETCESGPYIWIAYSMEIAPGQPLRWETWDEALFVRWGQTVGMLHRLAQQYTSWEAAVDPATGQHYLNWREEWEGFKRICPDDDVRQKWTDIGRALEALPVTRDAFGFIHNDPHIVNLVDDGTRVTLLDFDVANHHWFINDIAIACQSVLFSATGGMERPVQDRARLNQFWTRLREGYGRENHLAAEWFDHLDLFIAYRRILLFIVMHGWVSSQPALHESWKKMILAQPAIVGA